MYTHHETRARCAILLPDSGDIQEEDARFYTRHKLGKHAHPEPLYNRATAEASMALFEAVNFAETVTVGDIRFHLQTAGHMPGAASIILAAEGKRIGFQAMWGAPMIFLCIRLKRCRSWIYYYLNPPVEIAAMTSGIRSNSLRM